MDAGAGPPSWGRPAHNGDRAGYPAGMTTTEHGPHKDPTALGPLEPGTPQRVAARRRTWDVAWTATCVLLALWSVLWAVGALRGAAEAWLWSGCGIVLLGCAWWARRSVRKNALRPMR